MRKESSVATMMMICKYAEAWLDKCIETHRGIIERMTDLSPKTKQGMQEYLESLMKEKSEVQDIYNDLTSLNY